MSRPTIQINPGDRGVSELVGVVLLFGIVIAGAMMIFVSGTTVMDDVRAESRVDSAENAFSNMDGTLQSLAQEEDSSAKPVDLGAVDSKNAEIRDTGDLSITIDENSACSASLDLNALEYEDDSGAVVAYESGAIWKDTESGVVVEKAPEITYEDGSLQLEVIKLEGDVENENMRVSYDEAESTQRTQQVVDALFPDSEESCQRPENVTITVNSEYYEAWGSYFESEFPSTASIDTDNSAGTVTAKLGIDEEYGVIDLPGPGTGEVINTGGNDKIHVGTGSDDTDYPGTLTFLGSENAALTENTTTEEVWDNESEINDVTVWANTTKEVELEDEVTFTVNDTEWYWNETTERVWNNTTERKRTNATPPLEVSFVIDESGSMAQQAKIEDARDATRTFMGVMLDNQSHRVNLIGYDCWYGSCEYGYHDIRTLQAFTTDQDAINSSLWDLDAGGGTPIPAAINGSVREFEEDGNSSNNQVMVILTDGKSNQGQDDDRKVDPIQTARDNIPDDVTVYTIGVGTGVNDYVLTEIAKTGDGEGEYIHVTDSSDLNEVFSTIARNETTEVVEVNKSKNVTTRTKESRVVPRTVTVDAEDDVSVEFNFSRTVEASEPYGEGDSVWVNGTETKSAGSTVVVNETLERRIYYINYTDTEDVTKETTTTLSEETSATVNESVVLGDDRKTWDNETVEETTTEHLVVRRPTTIDMMYNSSWHTPWGSANLNAHNPTVSPGGFSNVVVDHGSMIQFEPTMYECASNTTLDEQITIDGTERNLTTCDARGSETNLHEDVSVFINGDTLPSSGSLDWQTSLKEMLTVNGEQYYEMNGGTMEAANLSSNQAIVIVEADDGDGEHDSNNVVLLLELGNAKDEVSGEHLVNVQVTAVVTEDDDED